jgi:LysM repeat protein
MTLKKAPRFAFFLSLLCMVMLVSPVRSFAHHKARGGAGASQKAPKKHRSSSDRRQKSTKSGKRGKANAMERQAAGARAVRGLQAIGQVTEPRVPAAEVAAGEDDNGEYMEYRVKRGDTLDKLSQTFNISREDIVDLNKVGKRQLKPGMTVFIPRPASDGDEEPVVSLNDRPMRPWKSDEERGILVKVAKSFAGAPYRYGGDSVRGLDCSAFVRKMYEIFEVQLPRSAREQYCAGQRVNKEDLTTGDLVFFRTRPFAHYPTHVGIYIGDGKFIHASSLLHRGVKVDHLSEGYFTRTYMGAVRVKSNPQTMDKTETDQEQHKG